LDAVGFDEKIKGFLGIGLGLGLPDLVQCLLCFSLDCFG
jgi:hypothetical protein